MTDKTVIDYVMTFTYREAFRERQFCFFFFCFSFSLNVKCLCIFFFNCLRKKGNFSACGWRSSSIGCRKRKENASVVLIWCSDWFLLFLSHSYCSSKKNKPTVVSSLAPLSIFAFYFTRIYFFSSLLVHWFPLCFHLFNLSTKEGEKR